MPVVRAMSAVVVVAPDNLRHWPTNQHSAITRSLVDHEHRAWGCIQCRTTEEFLYAAPAGSCVTCLWCARRGP